jgi:transposase
MESVTYVGMDVHKETIAIAVMQDDSRDIAYERGIRNDVGKIKRFFTKLKEKESIILACYEAGPTGYALYRQLTEMGIQCVIAAPSLLPRRPGDKIKTDRRDAVLLVKALRNREITQVHVLNRSDEAVRDYLRMCEDLRGDLKRAKQRLLQFLLRLGFKYDSAKAYWTQAHRVWMKGVQFEHPLQKTTFQELYTVVCEREEKIARFEEKIEELAAEERYEEKVSNLKCLKGIQTFTALSIVTEIGDFRRFACAREFMSYLGLVPSEHSSGERSRRGGITKAGNSRLRRLLVESSWHYQTYNPSKRLAARRRGKDPQLIAYADKAGRRLSKKYQKFVRRGKEKQKAVIALARELSGFIWGIMMGKTA